MHGCTQTGEIHRNFYYQWHWFGFVLKHSHLAPNELIGLNYKTHIHVQLIYAHSIFINYSGTWQPSNVGFSNTESMRHIIAPQNHQITDRQSVSPVIPLQHVTFELFNQSRLFSSKSWIRWRCPDEFEAVKRCLNFRTKYPPNKVFNRIHDDDFHPECQSKTCIS